MLVLKGSLLGILMFCILFAIRYHRVFWPNIVHPRVISAITVHNTFFWLGLVGCILVGCAIVGFWRPFGVLTGK
jgi:hypothetical protein